MTDKKKIKQKRFIEEPIIDKSGESLKKLYQKEKNKAFKKGLSVKTYLPMKVLMIKRNFIQKLKV